MNTTTERQPTVLERRPLDTLNVNDLAVLRRIIGEVIDNSHWLAELPFPAGDYNEAVEAHQRGKVRQRDAFVTEVLDKVIAEAIPAVKEMP